ncbi:hypothetical protein ACH4SP_16010 [Streptomyces sp. NPDC021093]|uniref:hypothetical protein n=1 Tax=Streptomyces sp. NPDC021093 TaxID=3365112 RepID=UPI0037880FCA
MTTSRREHPTQTTGSTGTTGGAGTTGAHRTRWRAPRTLAQRPPSRYEPYLDGLFTYALSVLRDHDVATAVLGDVLALAERSHGRSPSGEPERKAWLYALTRWSCLRSLAEEKRRRQGAHGGHQAHRPPSAVPEPELPVEESVARRRHADLTLLAWPEAAGTTPEQREALELAVRHGLGARQVAAVLGLDHPEARELLAAAACEVERTRAALIVVETGTCPTVTRLTGDDQVLLSTALRGELVRHVDDCPVCRRAAERAGAGGPWPGTGASAGRLPLVEAPRAAAYVAMLHAPRVPRGGVPRFDREGFPLDPKDRAARRERLRTRALTTTVVATVVAAPILALWAAYRGAPTTGEGPRGASVTASEADGTPGRDGAPYDGGGDAYENTGNAHSRPGPGPSVGSGARGGGQDVSVKVVTPGRASAPGAGRLAVAAESAGHTTVVRLTVSGGGPVAWSMWANAPWLHLSRTSGTLAPGESFTVYITVDRDREPADPWTARLGVSPSGAVMTVSGRGAMPTPSEPRPSDPGPGGTEGPGPGPTVPTTPPPSPTASQSPSTPPTSPPPTTDPPSTPPPSTPPPTEQPSPTATQPSEPGPSGTG